MTDFFASLASGFGISDVFDVAIVAFVIYKILCFIRETRAEQLVKGLLFLVAATFLSDVLNMHTLNWLFERALTLGVIALIIVFQPELRRGLEYIGRSKFVRPRFVEIKKESAKQAVATIVRATDYFSANRIGALIVMERETALTDIVETGTHIDSEISLELIKTIFYAGAPLHDGAAIIRGDRVIAAGCVLPLTTNRGLSRDLGTRHRAGIGITEHSDAIVIIVSEETGIISIAVDGELSRFLEIKTVEKTLLNLYLNRFPDETSKPFLARFFGKARKQEGDDD
ncbi:MAG TPA: TIGR00159 family protein [Clostridiales bacterium]|jgi:diadenylate cyclase|nr:TIGR00159 family protein [Clostridiales bacterium]